MPNAYNAIRSRSRRPGLIDAKALALSLPTFITGLQFWVAAYKETAFGDGDDVGTWTDFSGVNNHAVQATAANKPHYKTGIINGLPVLRFDGTQNDMVMTGMTAGSNTTFFFVIQPDGTSPVGIFDSAPGQSDKLCNYGAGDFQWHNAPVVALALANTNAIILTFLCTLNPSRQIVYYKNGVYIGTYTNASTNAMTWVNPRIGSINSGGQGWYDGDIAEIIVYRTALSAANLELVHYYLKNRYAL